MSHPYAGLPDAHFWRKFVSDVSWRDLNLNDEIKFDLKATDKIATAGSCFAQHISRYMKKINMEIFNTEPVHPLMVNHGGDIQSYEQFSARYGNVYTSRQFLELLKQAVGVTPMIEDFWEKDGRWYDLMRPNIEKDGFSSLRVAMADRRYHLTCVKRLFSEANVFIFTLGLTECWFNKINGHAYPACPGTVRGQFDPDIHIFKNLSYQDVMNDMEELIELVQSINPAMKMILTVSPVPLVATHTKQNVLLASSYSKSVLRAVAGDLHQKFDHISYFPSYEIISHAASFGQYLASDLREVTERGVSHVMGCFLKTLFPSLAKERIKDNSVLKASPIQNELPPPAACEEIFNFPSTQHNA